MSPERLLEEYAAACVKPAWEGLAPLDLATRLYNRLKEKGIRSGISAPYSDLSREVTGLGLLCVLLTAAVQKTPPHILARADGSASEPVKPGDIVF
jgi:hypothetical protein